MMDIRQRFKKQRACVLMPTYNNAATLDKVLSDVMNFTDQIIIINDGSTDSTAKLLGKYPSIHNVSYTENRGKGYALRQGFREAVALGYDYAITIDSDGQHYADDLVLFLDKLEEHPTAIIIGARNMDQSSVPGKSSFGNNFSNFWFRVETGLRLTDTQSGYRLYPVRLLKDVRFITRKYEFEIEVLVRAAWLGIEIVEIPVRVYYPEKEKRISHFRPFRDFTRISMLNTVLVTLAFLYIKPRDFFRFIKEKKWRDIVNEYLFNLKESDRVKAFSVGFGVFMGIVPIWGFQLATAIPLSFLLRLNKALVIIAAHISIPPMIPLILFLSHLTGSVWMGDDAQRISFSRDITLVMIEKSFLQYILGAITLATVAGVIFGGVTYLLLKLLKKVKY